MYRVEVEHRAAKSVTRLPRHDAIRVLLVIEALAEDPRPTGCTKLVGTSDSYRVRVGDYRIVYVIEDAIRVVTVTRVAHRREIYRSM